MLSCANEASDLELEKNRPQILDLIAEAQTGIKGTVRDFTGQPLNGAIVKVLPSINVGTNLWNRFP